MSTTVREPESKDFTPAPQGLHQGVCVDVFDIETEKRDERWGGGLRDVTRIVWELDEINPENGKPFSCSKKYTASLNEKATLRHDLESWRGRAFTQEELKGFDLEKVIGVNAQVMVMHNTKDGKTYANVATVTPLGKGQAKIAGSKDYVRKKDRKAASVQQAADEFQATDEDVPF